MRRSVEFEVGLYELDDAPLETESLADSASTASTSAASSASLCLTQAELFRQADEVLGRSGALVDTALGRVSLRLSGDLERILTLLHALHQRADAIEADAAEPGEALAGQSLTESALPPLVSAAESAAAESALVSRATLESMVLGCLTLLGAVSCDRECAEEIGFHGGHKLVLQMVSLAGSDAWPWNVSAVEEAASELLAATLHTLGAVIKAVPLGALDARPRPFFVSLTRESHDVGEELRVLLREVRPDAWSEAPKEERPNMDVGYKLWGASLVLSGELLDLAAKGGLEGKKVLEVGAGLGLCGIVAAHFDAAEVVVSDFHPRIVGNLAYNLALNGCGPSESVRAAALDWETVGDAEARPDVQGPFDVILGSDVVCREADVELLAEVFRTLLCPGSGRAYVTLGSEQSRFGAGSFERIITGAGLAVEATHNVHAPAICLPPAEGDAQGSHDVFVGTATAYSSFVVSLPIAQVPVPPPIQLE